MPCKLNSAFGKSFAPLATFSMFATFTTIAIFIPGRSIIAKDKPVEELVVWGSDADQQFGNSGPVSVLTQEDFVSINVATTEDVVKYEPSIVIRRRFIGDANGVLGMRGSNMFQTSRSMVFADGVPLHYLLQTRWNGSPRWTMVSASEIAQVKVRYGPFSAEYSGNSMGGVVEIETAIPQRSEFHFDSSFFSQNFNDYGFDDSVNGYKSFISYGNKIGDTSFYLSFNRLENEAQPQTFRFGGGSSVSDPIEVTGALVENDERGRERLWFMDTGIVDAQTNNYKFKLGQDLGEWKALLNVAYEDRSSSNDSANSYLTSSDGNTVYSGNVVQDGVQFSLPSTRFAASELERRSVSTGLRLRGPVTDSIELEVNVNQFSVLRNETRSSRTHLDDPAFTPAGQVSDFDDTGWNAAEVKLYFSDLGVPGLSLVAGARHESYELNFDVFASNNFAAGTKDKPSSSSGGETEINALYAQLNWEINEQWDMTLGLRAEEFQSTNGYFDDDEVATPGFDLIEVPKRSHNKTSPKFSAGYRPNTLWSYRYSVAKAYRFPIVEELFSEFEAFNSISIANAGLSPEDGLHHNFMIQRELENGYLRMNFFTEKIKEVIESQSATLENGVAIRTFLPVDEIETTGLEFIINSNDLLINGLDVRFNLVATDSEIVKNAPNRAIEGNVYPRMPKWRSNLLATYHIGSSWDIGGNLQYASNSFGRTDNTDRQDNVYGAQDKFTRVGLKFTYRLDAGMSFGLGVDNLTDEVSYVAHPWPGRTFYANFAYDL
jgi:iron complex outermembrane receptor protein|tara:strand:+ start:1033 stop:3351 length:2319 start_codon:yes stop_codon:yes gene_type:complete